MKAGAVRELRIDECREVLEDFPHAADGKLKRVAIRERRIDVAVVRAVQRFLQEIIF